MGQRAEQLTSGPQKTKQSFVCQRCETYFHTFTWEHKDTMEKGSLNICRYSVIRDSVTGLLLMLRAHQGGVGGSYCFHTC